MAPASGGSSHPGGRKKERESSGGGGSPAGSLCGAAAYRRLHIGSQLPTHTGTSRRGDRKWQTCFVAVPD